MDEHPGTHREARAAVIFWGADLVNVSEKRRETLKKTYVATMGGGGRHALVAEGRE